MTGRLYSRSILSLLVLFIGCDRKTEQSNPTPFELSKPEAVAPKAPAAGHGGAVVELGETTVDGMKIKASRDQGEIMAGGDVPIDVWVMTPDGKPATVAAVRFWIGTEDAKGSIKARADIEIPAEPNHWHTHAEVPNPLPSDARLWVEIEASQSRKTTVSFDLKR